MAKEAPIYDLTLLLSNDAEEDQRKKILSDVESAISAAGGSVERNDEWGRRPLAFEIRHQTDAEYHLLQFRAPGTLLEELSHTLRITDGVLRFRVIKNRPGTPPAPSSPPPVVVAASQHAPASAPHRSPAEANTPTGAPDSNGAADAADENDSDSSDESTGAPEAGAEDSADS